MNFFVSFKSFFLDFRLLLILFILFLKFLFCSAGCFTIMKRRQLKLKFFAFFPFINSSYCIGAINDSINKDYLHETFSRFNVLMLKVIRCVSNFFLIFVLMFYSNETRDVFTNFVFSRGFNFMDFFKICFENNFIRILLLISFFVSVAYFIYLFKIYINIFNEYGGQWNKVALLFSILSYLILKFFFVPDLFVYIFRNKKSKFEILNKADVFI